MPNPPNAAAAAGAVIIDADVVADVLTYPQGPPAVPYNGPGDDPAATKTRRRVVQYRVAGQARTAMGAPNQAAMTIANADLAANPLPADVTDWLAKITAATAAGASDRAVLDAILATLLHTIAGRP